MRRLSVILALATAIVVPAIAAAGTGGAGDGSLVVKNGSAPYVPGVSGTPVVQMTITGSVIGQVGAGKLVIDAGPNADPNSEPIVTGAGVPSDSKISDTAQVWKGTGFKFRAVGGTYTVLVYGTQVNL